VVAVVGVSGLVSLQLSTSRARPGAAPTVSRSVIGLKEHQMDALAGGTTKPRTEVRQSLALAEQVIIGEQPPPAPRTNIREVSPSG
jgi:hypothetical protein